MNDTPEYRYDVFVSYRHTEGDRIWAKWLVESLETYRVPAGLVAAGAKSGIDRVFRDEDELPSSADLGPQLEEALRQSRYLIVICSKDTPDSQWVNAEVQAFRDWGRHDQILALLVDGEPSESFPEALGHITETITHPDGTTTETVKDVEPLAADVRPRADESPKVQKDKALLRIVATLIGVRYDDLWQRHDRRQTRRTRALWSAAVATLILVAGLTYQYISTIEAEQARTEAQRQEAEAQRIEAEAQRIEAEAQRMEADTQRQEADTQRQEAEQQAIRARQQALKKEAATRDKENQHSAALAFLRAALQLEFDAKSDVKQTVAEMVDREFKRPANRVFSPIQSPVNHSKFSPHGHRVLVEPGGEKPMLLDTKTGRQIASLEPFGEPLWKSYFSPDGHHLMTLSRAGEAVLWNGLTGERLHVFSEEAGIRHASFSSDSENLILSSREEIILWDLQQRKTRLRVRPSENREFDLGGPISRAFLIPKSQTLLIVRFLETELWDATTGTLKKVLEYPHPVEGPNRELVFSPNERLAVMLGSNIPFVYDTETGQVVYRLRGHQYNTWGAAFSPNGDTLVTISSDGIARSWDLRTGAHIHTFQGEGDSFNTVFIDARSEMLLTGSREGKVTFWDLNSGKPIPLDIPHGSAVTDVHMSDDRDFLYTITDEFVPRLWMLKPPSLSPYLSRESRQDIKQVSFTPDGHSFATLSDELQFWYTRDGHQKPLFFDPLPYAKSFNFSPDGQTLLTVQQDHRSITTQFWDLSKGMPTLIPQAFENTGKPGVEMYSAEFSPDGKLLATVPEKGPATIWDVATQRPLRIIPNETGTIHRARFHNDGDRLIIAATGSVRIWQASTGQMLRKIAKGIGRAKDALLTKDGEQLILVIHKNRVRDDAMIMSLESGVAESLTVEGKIYSVDLHPLNGIVVIASTAGTSVWDVTEKTKRLFLPGLARHAEFDPAPGGRLAIADGFSSTFLSTAKYGARVLTVPDLSNRGVLHRTGTLTNYRVCEKTLEVVAVLPFPTPPEDVWAPAHLCGREGGP